MSISYRTKANKRSVGNELLILAEQHLIGISGAFTATPDRIRLVEVPLEEDPSSVVIPGYTEVPFDGPAPLTLEFAVDYTLGRVYFHPSQNGVTVFVTYKGRGSEVDSEDVNELQIPVGYALNSNGTLSSGIVHPVNITTALEDFVFPQHVTANGNIIGGGSISVVNDIGTTLGNLYIGGTTAVLNNFQSGAPTLDAYLTINRGTSGDVSLKWNETSDAWEFLNDVGSPIFQIYNSGAIAFNSVVQAGDGTITVPAYSFLSETDLGFYRVGSGSIAFVNGGAHTLRIGATTIQSSLQHLFSDGTVAAPGIAFASEQTGFYRPSANNLSVSIAGVQQLSADSGTGYLTSALKVSTPDGTAAFPAWTFSSDTTTGIYKGGVSQLDISLAGVNTVAVSPTSLSSTVKFLAPNGTAFLPSYSFSSEPATGISLPFSQNLVFSIDSVGEVARFTPLGDFKLIEGEKVIFDNVGDAFLRFTGASAMYGQTSNLGGFHFGSNNELVLFANSVVGEPTLSMLTDGTFVAKNSTQGTDLDRTFKLEISQQFASGYHRTFQLFPSDAMLGTYATGTVTVVDWTMLSGAVLTVDGFDLTEGVQWTAATSNDDTATSLASAIALSGVASGVSSLNVVTITANDPGIGGNSITLDTSDAVNLTLSAPTLLGGTDDFVIALGYKADGSTVSAGTLDTHGFPLIITVDDTEMVEVDSSTVDVKNHKITTLADPTADQDAANKRYVDSIAAGLDPKASSRISTTSTLTLTTDYTRTGTGATHVLTATVNGVLSLDGVSTGWVDIDNDGGSRIATDALPASRVLVKNASDAKDNGIYAVKDRGSAGTPWKLIRAADFDGSPTNEVSGGNFTFVEQGTTLAGTGWVVVADGALTVDTDNINWTQFSQPSYAFAQYSADPGSPVTGQVWFNTTDSQFKGYNGTSVIILG